MIFISLLLEKDLVKALTRAFYQHVQMLKKKYDDPDRMAFPRRQAYSVNDLSFKVKGE